MPASRHHKHLPARLSIAARGRSAVFEVR